MIHQLKCKPNFFEDIIAGRKAFEVRNNDRNFHIGDYLALNELTERGMETGRSALFRVCYMLKDSDYCKEGYAVLGIEACRVEVIGIGCEPTILEEGE